MIKIFATDMDGTLLDNQSRLPKNIETVIKEINKRGKLFIVASGRTISNLEYKFKDIDADISYISDNGAILKHKGNIEYINKIQKQDVLETIEILRSTNDSTTVLITPTTAYIESDNKYHHSFLTEYYTHLTLVDDLRKYSKDVIKITALSPTSSHDNYKKIVEGKLPNRIYGVEAGEVWIDIMNKGVNKAVALQYIMDKYHVSNDEVVTFGDYFNDLEMIKLPKYGYVVSEAPEEMKLHAYEVIGSNEDNAVLNKIQDLLKE